MDTREIYDAVLDRYSVLDEVAESKGAYSKSVARSFGYTEDELASIPAQANLGLSCGNPLAIASLREGETVIDLGSGAGFDVFLAARKVGPTGRAIGVDMNKAMLSLAEKNKAKSGVSNVEFVKGRITSVPLEDGIANAIISNCVINLVPETEKQLVFNEMFRLLKPGGRVAVSDILAKKPLPEKLRKGVAAYVGCFAGASLVSQYQTYFREAGFGDVFIQDAHNDLNVYIETLPDGTKRTKNDGQSSCGDQQRSACCGSNSSTAEDKELSKLAVEIGDTDLNEWIGSYKIFAVKP